MATEPLKPQPSPAETQEKVVVPKAGSPEHTLLEGLKLIADGHFEHWVTRHCHHGKLCTTPQAIKSLKHYNLRAAQKLVPQCLRGESRDALHVTRMSQEGLELKLFLACHPKGMPRPFTLEKEKGVWKFRRI